MWLVYFCLQQMQQEKQFFEAIVLCFVTDSVICVFLGISFIFGNHPCHKIFIFCSSGVVSSTVHFLRNSVAI